MTRSGFVNQATPPLTICAGESVLVPVGKGPGASLKFVPNLRQQLHFRDR